MAIRFDSDLLFNDLTKHRKRKRLSENKAAYRMGIHPSTISRMGSGQVKDITVTTLARILDFLEETDVQKYIYDDGE